jgi:hypothetical protein
VPSRRKSFWSIKTTRIPRNWIDVPDHDKIFSLANITSKCGLEAVNEVNLDDVTDEQIFGGSDGDIVVEGVENVRKRPSGKRACKKLRKTRRWR